MKTLLGTEVDVVPGHMVLDAVPAVRERGTAAAHLFGPCLLWSRSPISATAELLFSFTSVFPVYDCANFMLNKQVGMGKFRPPGTQKTVNGFR